MGRDCMTPCGKEWRGSRRRPQRLPACEQTARGKECLPGHFLGIPRPGRWVRGLIAQIAAISFLRQSLENLPEGDAAVARRKPVQGFPGCKPVLGTSLYWK